MQLTNETKQEPETWTAEKIEAWEEENEGVCPAFRVDHRPERKRVMSDTTAAENAEKEDETASQKWMCGGCGNVVSQESPGPCLDCGERFHPASADEIACDRCGDPDGKSVLGNYDRLCEDCIEEEEEEEEEEGNNGE